MIKDMANAKRSGGGRRPRRLGKGPAGERDMDIDSDEEEDEELSLVDVRARVLRAGFTESQLQETLDSVRRSYLSDLPLLTDIFRSTSVWMS
jgi:DNA replication licensing factor MCM7